MRSVRSDSILRVASSAARSCFAARSGSLRSTMPSARNARSPISFAAFAAWSAWKYMSLDVVGREPRLRGPDPRLEPRREVHVVPVAAEQTHGGVRVQVHEAGERDAPL